VGAHIRQTTYRGIKEYSAMRPDQSRGTIHSSPKYAITGSDRMRRGGCKPYRGNGTSSACISVFRRSRQLRLIVRSTYRGIKECSVMRPDQSRGTIHSSLNTQIQAATEAQRKLQTLQEQRYFIGLYLGDEATKTTQTNFSECTLNSHTSPKCLSVEFE
jgi:hypothetical protein